MGVTNNYNLSGTGNSSITQDLINQSPDILFSNSSAGYNPTNELISTTLNASPNILLGGTGISSLVSSGNSFLHNAQGWLNGYESSNNLPITSIGNGISGVLSGLANLTNAVGGVFAIKNGIATGYSQPYINGQPTTYNRTNQQSVNPLTGKHISATQFPTESVLIIGGLVIAVILVMEII